MSDLYSEIVAFETMETMETMGKTVDAFINEIVEDPTVRDTFFEDYADAIVHSMSIDDLIADYTQRILNDLYAEFDENREDLIVNECAEHNPEVLEKYGVSVEIADLAA